MKIELNASNVGQHFNWSDEGLAFTELKGNSEVSTPYWIEYWNATEKKEIVWVKADVPGTLYMYYNAGKQSQSNSQSVFIDDIPGLVGFWDFDEGQGDVVHDKSGYGNDGTIHGMYSLDFDGVDDYISYPNNEYLNITQNISLVAWVKQAEGGAFYEIPISKHGSYFLGAKSTNYKSATFGLFFSENTNYYLKSDTLPETWLGKWHLLTGTYDGHTMKLYIDGELNATYTITKQIKLTNSEIRIGQWASSDWCSGSIAEVRVYNRTLNSTEIQKLYSLGPGADYAKNGLVLWLNFGKKNVNDQSGNGNDGTIHGDPHWIVDGPYSGWVDGKFGKALRFDGNDDWISVPPNPSLDNLDENVSLDYTIKTTANMSGCCCLSHDVFSKYQNYKGLLVGVSYDTEIFASFSSGASQKVNAREHIDGPSRINNGEWHNVVGIKKGKSAEIYYDGNFVTNATNNDIGNIKTSSAVLLIGSGINGTIDNPFVMNTSLSDTQISEVYNNYAFATPDYKGHLLIRKGYELPTVEVKDEEVM